MLRPSLLTLPLQRPNQSLPYGSLCALIVQRRYAFTYNFDDHSGSSPNPPVFNYFRTLRHMDFLQSTFPTYAHALFARNTGRWTPFQFALHTAPRVTSHESRSSNSFPCRSYVKAGGEYLTRQHPFPDWNRQS
jgi:hypothetical protein